ncbi:MAG: ASCH domain-containing protein [Gorillibacterium sp.]|nr:ASCH domain-containing protein [Gorillibacterium sp.]
MKAITIHQPWATLVAIKVKENETRGWATKHRGKTAIHAGKKVEREACMREPIRSILAAYGYTAENLPTGAVVAIVNLADCQQVIDDNGESAVLRNQQIISRHEYAFGDFSEGRYAWKMSEVEQLSEPIPAKGQQGLWNWNAVNKI